MTLDALETAKRTIEYLARGVEFAAALIIGVAAIEATFKAIALFFNPKSDPARKNDVRLTFARWLAVALELELGADILNTAVTPTWNDIGKLAAIAALRTALNYSLEKEIEKESKPEQKAAEKEVVGS